MGTQQHARERTDRSGRAPIRRDRHTLHEHQLQAIVDQSSDLLMIVDGERVVRWANAAFERVLGRPAESFVGSDVFQFVHPDDLPALAETIDRMSRLHGGSGTASFRMRSADGSWRWLETSARNLLDDPALNGFVVSLRDVTERMATEAALRESEERFGDLIEHARDAVYTADLDGFLTSANPATERLTGFARAELLTMNFFELIAPEDRARAREILARRVAGGRDEPVELRLLAKDGHTVFVDVVGRPIAPVGRAPSLIGIARDTTERHVLEERLRHQVLHDALTGLANRTLFFDRLEVALARTARNESSSVAVMLLDVDGFKLVNDTLGHAAGDELLVELAVRLRSTLRKNETAARLGGDEFAVIAEGIQDERELFAIARRIQLIFEQPFAVDNTERGMTGSLGLALSIGGQTSPNGLVRDADAAMYRAKACGKGRFVLSAG